MIRILSLLFVFMLASCQLQKHFVTIDYLKSGIIQKQSVPLHIISKSGKIKSDYIDSVQFSVLDSISFANNNPDRKQTFSKPYVLHFNQHIKKYSPEYYSIYAVFNIDKAIQYYNRLFNNKIDFNSQQDYKNIGVLFGDISLLTSPKDFIFEPRSNPSPSLFYHETGHRAFWYLEDNLEIKFKGLSYIHMGLLEYFTVSLNNSPVVGEDFLPKNLIRDASKRYQYPPTDSLYIRTFFSRIKEAYPKELENHRTNLSKYYYTSTIAYSKYMNSVLDNHRAGMIITSTLWRIRQQIGQEKTDSLVAQTILNLNSYFERRSVFYHGYKEEVLPGKIEWYDLYYGLLQKDDELNNGVNRGMIEREFKITGFPIEKVKVTNL